jgi:hypothetical protein
MVLYNPKTKAFVSDIKEIRKQLKLNSSAKNVTVKPMDVPKGLELYIQSTSSTRKLIGGYAILRGMETEDTLPSAPPAKKAKLVEADEEDEGKSRETPRISGPTSRKTKQDWLTNWSEFDQLPDFESDDFPDSEMIKCTDIESRNSVDDCDKPVPVEFLEKLHSQILGVLRDGLLRWSAPSYKKLEGISTADEPASLWIWESADRRPVQALRLLYYASPSSSDVIIALEQKGDFAVVFHIIGGHPGIITNGFVYANSDGSGDTFKEPMPGTPTPDLVIIRLLNYVWEHGHDIYH